MDKQQLMKRLDKAWVEFKMSYEGLSDAQMTTPGVTGDWSVKDLIAHVTWWEEESLTHLPHIVQGIRPPRYSVQYGGIDAFNAQMFAHKRELSLADALRQQAETHARLIAYLQGVRDDQLTSETRFRRRLRLDTYGHYPIHTRMIREWRERTAQ
jgi:hypothetical protein